MKVEARRMGVVTIAGWLLGPIRKRGFRKNFKGARQHRLPLANSLSHYQSSSPHRVLGRLAADLDEVSVEVSETHVGGVSYW